MMLVHYLVMEELQFIMYTGCDLGMIIALVILGYNLTFPLSGSLMEAFREGGNLQMGPDFQVKTFAGTAEF